MLHGPGNAPYCTLLHSAALVRCVPHMEGLDEGACHGPDVMHNFFAMRAGSGRVAQVAVEDAPGELKALHHPGWGSRMSMLLRVGCLSDSKNFPHGLVRRSNLCISFLPSTSFGCRQRSSPRGCSPHVWLMPRQSLVSCRRRRPRSWTSASLMKSAVRQSTCGLRRAFNTA